MAMLLITIWMESANSLPAVAKMPVSFPPIMVGHHLVCPTTGWSGHEEEAHRSRARRPPHTLNGPPGLLRDADPNRFHPSVSVSSCPRILLSSQPFLPTNIGIFPILPSMCMSVLLGFAALSESQFCIKYVSTKMSSSLANGKIKVIVSQIECLCTQVFSV